MTYAPVTLTARVHRPPGGAGFTFIEVLFALSILLVGSVAILSLFALGADEMVQRRIDAREAQLRPQVETMAQDALDSTKPDQLPAKIAGHELDADYTVDIEFVTKQDSTARLEAHAVLYFRGSPVRALPPMPLTRSTLDPR
jgi:prepilin-type N-terminal cleavage/methylation domain-containing protein